jgi:tetratricopeptide (TPR) repeat protein
MKQHMNNFLSSISFLLITAFFAIGCAEAQNKKANKLYVEASMEASQFLDKAWDHNYSKLNDTYTSAKEKIDTILSKYPSSDIAVGLISEQIKISGLTVKQFMGKAIIVKQMKDSEESPLSCAQLIAMETINSKKEKSRMFFHMANLHARVGLKDKVRLFLSKAFEVANNSITMDDKSDALFVIAKTYAEFGYLENALEVVESINNPDDRIRALVEITCEYADIIEKEKALQMLSYAHKKVSPSIEYRDYYLEDLAIKYAELGLLDQSLNIVISIDDAEKKIGNLISLASKYAGLNKREKSIYILSQAFNDSKNVSDYDLERILINIAVAYIDVGEKEKAAQLLAQALDMNNKYMNLYSKSIKLGEIAGQYARIEQYDQVAQLLSKAFKATESINDEKMAIDAYTLITCEYADLVQNEHATQALLENFEMVKNLNKGFQTWSLSLIASKLADLGQLDKAIAVWDSNNFVNNGSYTEQSVNIASKFIDLGRWDKAFRPFQIGHGSYAVNSFLEGVFEKYTAEGHTVRAQDLISKILEVAAAETTPVNEYWLVARKISDYYAKLGLKEEESKLLWQIFDTVRRKANEDFIVEGLTETAVKFSRVGERAQVENMITQLLETAQETNKSTNKVALLTTASSIYEKIGTQPNHKDKTVLHDIVSEIDPLVNL